MIRLIPTRAAIIAAIGAGIAAFLAWLRFDARRDALETLEKKDLKNADEITDRVSDSRADPERLRKYDDAGYRD